MLYVAMLMVTSRGKPPTFAPVSGGGVSVLCYELHQVEFTSARRNDRGLAC